MAQRGQDERTRLLVDDVKFEPSKACKLCGMPTRSVAEICLRCLDAQYLTEELTYTREWLREHPGLQIELGHDKHRVQHMVLLRSNVRNTGWCGARVTQMKAKRVMAPPGMFPPGICVQCLAAYEGMGL